MPFHEFQSMYYTESRETDGFVITLIGSDVYNDMITVRIPIPIRMEYVIM